MEFEVIGNRVLDFEGKDGSSVSGMQLFLAYSDDEISGRGCMKMFIPERKLSQFALPFEPGDRIRVNFDMRGKVHSIEPLS
ncbi:MAG: hypothetical protein PHW03_09825 [Eubacteriales bacterium]|nr:hypothetical protein [Eubacteriales bacterium]